MFTHQEREFGRIGDDSVVEYTISNGLITVAFLNYGAMLLSFKAPDRNGVVEELTLNRSTLDDIRFRSDYFGSTIGRSAFRIKEGHFSLGSVDYQLATNSGNNHNHGGVKGFDKCLWNGVIEESEDRISVVFTRVSEDMEEGYPGRLDVRVRYSLTKNNELDMVFETWGNAVPTIVNMTNHTYWNLSGDLKCPVDQHKLQIESDYYLDGDDMIPFDDPIHVKGGLMDFTSLRSLSPTIHQMNGGGMPGIDHAFILRECKEKSDNDIKVGNTSDENRYKGDNACKRATKTLRHAAVLIDEESGRQFDLFTTECALIVYTSNWLNETAPFVPHYAVCLEPGYCPDAPNHPSFKSSVIEAGERYYHHDILKFSVHSVVF